MGPYSTLAAQLLVYPHGITDIWTHQIRSVLLSYAISGAVSAVAPIEFVKVLFNVSAAVHFGCDEACGSFVVMWALLANHWELQWLAETLVLAYMFGVHLPHHYIATAPPASAQACAGALGVLCALLNVDPYSVPRLSTALVTGHTLVHVAASPLHPRITQ